MKNTILVAAIACLSAFACNAAATLYQFKTLDFPGAPVTVARGINDAGTIVGNTNIAPFFDSSTGGFIFSGGNYTALSAPAGTPNALGPLSASGINNTGDITGTYQVIQPPPSFGPYAYILSGNTLTQASLQTGSFIFPTYGFGINNADTITGLFHGLGSASTSALYLLSRTGCSSFWE